MPLPIRPNVRAMTPYPAGKPAEAAAPRPGVSQVVKLASNENPLGPSPLAVRAAEHAAAQLHLYPDASYARLRQWLAEHLGVDAQNVAVGNGSDDLIHLVGLALLSDPTDEVVVGSPSFVRYDAVAQLAGCRLVRVPCLCDWRLDADGLAGAAGPSTRLIFLANPNNPTGTYLRAPELKRVAEAIDGSGLLVVDEAYYEFAKSAEGYPDCLEWVRQGAPVAVLRTFSKAYGLAGARLGCLVGPAELVDAIDREREPFLVNSVAQAAAASALADQEHVERSVNLVQKWMHHLVDYCARLGLPTVPSVANYICIEVGDDLAVAGTLEREGFIVRPGSKIGMPGYIRVSAALPEDAERFLAALASATERGAVSA